MLYQSVSLNYDYICGSQSIQVSAWRHVFEQAVVSLHTSCCISLFLLNMVPEYYTIKYIRNSKNGFNN